MSFRTVICDLDGTVADCSHRLIHINEKPKSWPKFIAGIPEDKPIFQTIEIVLSLWRVGYVVVFLTGRSEECRVSTVAWLNTHVPLLANNPLYMRPLKDHRPDYIIKEELFQVIKQEHAGPFVAFEDRGRVVDMWRKNGVFCFNANQGEDY